VPVGLRFRWLVAAILLACVAVFVACGGSGSTTGIPPITGIIIRAETLTSGRGCGRGPTQLFKYAAIVYGYAEGPADVKGSYRTPVTAGVYDCFADGTFVELPETGGSTTFRIDVFGYTEPAYTSARDVIENAGTNGTALRDSTKPTWTTSCTATQLRDVQALAVCEPLVSGLAPSSIILRTAAFFRANGTQTICIGSIRADAGADAGDGDGGGGGDAAADGAIDAATEASAEGGIDAGMAPLGLAFSTVRVTATSGGAAVVPQTDIRCPDTFVIPNAIADATYDLDVALLDDTAALVGTTKCSAKAVAGVETAASCSLIP
jgi:hypothetical protein